MNIIDFFKRKKDEEKSLVKQQETSLNKFIKRKTKFKNFSDFIKNSIEENNGNYEDIYNKLLAISDFTKNAKTYGIKNNCDFSRINEVLNDFFNQQSDIKFTVFKDNPYTAWYYKNDKSNRYNYRGVTILQDTNCKKPVLYFGRRNENTEIHRKDTALYFDNDRIMFRDYWKANYDEIPLFGSGTDAEFSFNDTNQITMVRFTYLEEPRLGFWSNPQIIKINPDTNQFTLTSQQQLDK